MTYTAQDYRLPLMGYDSPPELEKSKRSARRNRSRRTSESAQGRVPWFRLASAFVAGAVAAIWVKRT